MIVVFYRSLSIHVNPYESYVLNIFEPWLFLWSVRHVSPFFRGTLGIRQSRKQQGLLCKNSPLLTRTGRLLGAWGWRSEAKTPKKQNQQNHLKILHDVHTFVFWQKPVGWKHRRRVGWKWHVSGDVDVSGVQPRCEPLRPVGTRENVEPWTSWTFGP